MSEASRIPEEEELEQPHRLPTTSSARMDNFMMEQYVFAEYLDLLLHQSHILPLTCKHIR